MCRVFGLHSEFRNCNFVSIMKIVLIKIFHIFFSGTITMSIFIDWAIRLCCGFIWFLTLMCLSWPSAIPAALLYVLTLPFAGRSEITRTISNYLLRFVQLPLRCADNMFAMAPLCNTECNGQYAYYLYFADYQNVIPAHYFKCLSTLQQQLPGKKTVVVDHCLIKYPCTCNCCQTIKV